MHLNKIVPGQKANLTFRWQEKTLEFSATIVGMADSGPLIKPFRYKGNTIGLADVRRSDIVVDLFYVDPGTGERVGWSNIDLRKIEYEGKIYYQVQAKNILGLHSHSAERRNDVRVELNLPGTVIDLRAQKRYNAKYENINSGGVAFSMNEEDAIFLGKKVEIRFDDMVQDVSYPVKAECTIVRREHLESGRVLLGCRINRSTKTCQLYVFLKHAENTANIRREL